MKRVSETAKSSNPVQYHRPHQPKHGASYNATAVLYNAPVTIREDSSADWTIGGLIRDLRVDNRPERPGVTDDVVFPDAFEAAT